MINKLKKLAKWVKIALQIFIIFLAFTFMVIGLFGTTEDNNPLSLGSKIFYIIISILLILPIILPYIRKPSIGEQDSTYATKQNETFAKRPNKGIPNKTVNAILCTIVFCIVLTSCTKIDIESQDQRVEKIINGGQLYLIVETDKTIYDYDDYIYVTATLVNKTDKTITLNMPISKGNAHQELSIIIENDGNQLIDVDMHQNQQNNDKELFY